jgi:uncharacterized protein (DUF305 family)
MKKNLFKRGAAGTLAVAAVIALGVVNAAAQGHTGHTGQTGQQQQTGHTGHGQMGAMPYDLHYIDMTIMHHQQGIEMARLAEQKGQNARVKAFAKKTGDDQQKDMMELRGHRQHWYSDRPEMDHSQMMAHMEMMPAGKDKTMMQDMMKHSQDDMAKLQAAEGAAFDRLFLDTMTHHHQMAIDMSKDAVAKAEHKEIKDFARKTITKQNAEIAEMNRIRAAVGGTTARRPAPKKKAATKKPAAHAGHTGHQ